MSAKQPGHIRGKLPPDWVADATAELLAEVATIERYTDRGLLVLGGVDHKGYRWVRLCKGHPYADGKGWQRLHRYLMMRALGRRLEAYEHVHHDPAAPKDTTNIRDLSLTEAIDHARWHHGHRVGCGHHIVGWTGRDERGRFVPLPTPDSVASTIEAGIRALIQAPEHDEEYEP